MLTAPEAVRLLSWATGERYELVGRMAGGETGAHEVLGPDAQRLVVKWELDPASQTARRAAVGLTTRLGHEGGWPVPRVRTVETDTCLFVIQELLPGSPISRLTHSLVDEILRLHESRLGLERPEDHSRWPDELVRTLRTGGSGYCLHQPLRDHDSRTARIVTRVESIGNEIKVDDLPGGDVVHWDLHDGNLLEVDGRLTAVIDTDFVTTGDAAFDLVTLAMSSLTTTCEPGVRRRMFELAVDPLDEPRREAYVGHLLVRILDWSIRRHRPGDIELWIGQAHTLLDIE